MSSLREVGRGEKQLSSIYHYNLRVQAGTCLGFNIKGPWVKVDLRKRLPRPVFLPKLGCVPHHEDVRRSRIAMPSGHVNMEDDAQIRELLLPLGKALEQHASVEECVSCQNNLTFGLLEERLNH